MRGASCAKQTSNLKGGTHSHNWNWIHKAEYLGGLTLTIFAFFVLFTEREHGLGNGSSNDGNDFAIYSSYAMQKWNNETELHEKLERERKKNLIPREKWKNFCLEIRKKRVSEWAREWETERRRAVKQKASAPLIITVFFN